MEIEKQFEEMMAFQKRAIHLMLDMAVSFQTYAGSQTAALIEHANWVPEEAKNQFQKLTESFHVSGEALKKSADDGFDLLAGMFPAKNTLTPDAQEPTPALEVSRIIRAVQAPQTRNWT